MRYLKSGLVSILFLALATVLAALIWVAIPVQTDRSTPDPATLHLNALTPDADPFTDEYFEHDGRTLHYVDGGAGELVILLHGFPSYWYSFARQADALRADYRVIALDGLGVGRSDAPADVQAYRLETMAAHLLALVDHLGGERVHLVGHDWGAAFVFGFAQRYPGRVASVTGISAPPQTIMLELLENNPAQRESSVYIDRLKSANPVFLLALGVPGRIWNDAYRPKVEAGLLSAREGALFRDALRSPKRIDAHINWYRANIPAVEDITDASFWPGRDARIAVPALLIWGNDDTVFVPEFIDRMRQSSDRLRILRFDGVGHWPHLERADEVTGAIRALLQDASPAN